jgi:hypothetical protein
MERDWIEFDGYEYPVIRIEGKKIDFECETDEMYTICDIDLWDILERPCMSGDEEANYVDSQIFYYCESGFVANEPTEQEVIDYFKGLTY